MTCEARATVDEVVETLVDRVRSIVEGSAIAQGVAVSLALMGQSATVLPDDELVDLIIAAATSQSAVDAVERTRSLAGSDDANLLIRRVQQDGGWGAYLMVGAASPGPHHSATFDVDERVIPIGIDVLESLIRAT
jgi:aminobenzoyl-glutamate utilization protein A